MVVGKTRNSARIRWRVELELSTIQDGQIYFPATQFRSQGMLWLGPESPESARGRLL